MKGRISRRLSFANVISVLALFLAVGGGTTAIALRGRNTVDSGDVKNKTIRTKDLADNAATGRKVKESSLGIVPEAVHAENSDQLGGVPDTGYQFGNGITGAIAGGVDDGAGFGLIDLGSATLRIDCEDDPTGVTLNVKDDTGAPAPTTNAPTDVWIDGQHDAITSDGGSTPGVTVPATESTTPVQVWTADDVVTDAQFNVYFDDALDLCVITFPLSQNVPATGSTQSAAERAARLPRPRAFGFVGR